MLFVFVCLYAGVGVYEQGNRNERAEERYTHSELLLYKNLALSDAGMTKEALDHLEDCKDKARLTLIGSVWFSLVYIGLVSTLMIASRRARLALISFGLVFVLVLFLLD